MASPTPAHISTSHLSFVQRANNLNQLIALYAADSNYAPNEDDLTIDSLTTLYTAIKAANDNIGNIIQPVDGARTTRDAALYTPTTGMLDVAKKCKNYVKGIFGATNENTKLVTKIQFRRPAKKK